jgi:hypothetical protein
MHSRLTTQNSIYYFLGLSFHVEIYKTLDNIKCRLKRVKATPVGAHGGPEACETLRIHIVYTIDSQMAVRLLDAKYSKNIFCKILHLFFSTLYKKLWMKAELH